MEMSWKSGASRMLCSPLSVLDHLNSFLIEGEGKPPKYNERLCTHNSVAYERLNGELSVTSHLSVIH